MHSIPTLDAALFAKNTLSGPIDVLSQKLFSREAPEWVKSSVGYLTTCCIIILPQATFAVTFATAYPIVALAAAVSAISHAAHLYNESMQSFLPIQDAFLKKSVADFSTLVVVSIGALVTSHPLLGLAATISAVSRALHSLGRQLHHFHGPTPSFLQNYITMVSPSVLGLALAGLSTSPTLVLAARVDIFKQLAYLIGIACCLSQSNEELKFSKKIYYPVVLSVLALTTFHPAPAIVLASKIALATTITYIVQREIIPTPPHSASASS